LNAASPGLQIMSSSIAASVGIAETNSRPFDRFVATLLVRMQAMRARHVARQELSAMSAGELADMSITRHDVPRLFDAGLVPEFRARGSVGDVVDAETVGTVKLRPQGSATIATMQLQP
jgi:uncharacterized protein YjiS (DUF1127 family)